MLRRRKLLGMCAESPASGARFVGCGFLNNSLPASKAFALPLVDLFCNREIEFGFSVHQVKSVMDAYPSILVRN